MIIEYVWIDSNEQLRSKARVLLDDVSMPPNWNFDGSSTGQASGIDSEIILVPRSMFNDPFRKNNNKMVMCDTYYPNGEPLPGNNRHKANLIFNKYLTEEPWFGLEQEYFIMDMPVGVPNTLGLYYCGVGYGNAHGRHIAEDHLARCIEAGIKISGINAEVSPCQWEFQIGPCVGIEQGDHMWMARYILNRVSELHKVTINYHTKPLQGDWNGSGCHANFSTKNMREGIVGKQGIDFIYESIHKLSLKHNEHMKVYGSGNELRMTGKNETSDFNTFTYGVANRGKSIRIGNETEKNGKGYFEDRRPSSTCDPYLVTSKLVETTFE